MLGIPHSAVEGLLQAPMAYVPLGFYAVITGEDKDAQKFSWCEVQYDGSVYYPQESDWGSDFDDWANRILAADDDTTFRFNGLRRSGKFSKPVYSPKDGTNKDTEFIVNPAHELNGTGAPNGSIVWMMPTPTPDPDLTDPQDPESFIYCFSYDNLGPYGVEFAQDSVPEIIDSTDSSTTRAYKVKFFFLSDPTQDSTIYAYPNATLQESQAFYDYDNKTPKPSPAPEVPTIREVIRTPSTSYSADNNATRGFVVWAQTAYQKSDTHGNMIYYGQWQIVSAYSSTDLWAKVKPSGTATPNVLAHNQKVNCNLWWPNFGTNESKDSGYVVPVINYTYFDFVEGLLFNIIYDRQTNSYIVRDNTCLVLGKTDGTLAQGGSCTISVWGSTGSSIIDLGYNITAYDWLMKVGATAIAANKKVVCALINNIWIVIEAECA
jgi:hypothetical protein